MGKISPRFQGRTLILDFCTQPNWPLKANSGMSALQGSRKFAFSQLFLEQQLKKGFSKKPEGAQQVFCLFCFVSRALCISWPLGTLVFIIFKILCEATKRVGRMNGSLVNSEEVMCGVMGRGVNSHSSFPQLARLRLCGTGGRAQMHSLKQLITGKVGYEWN